MRYKSLALAAIVATSLTTTAVYAKARHLNRTAQTKAKKQNAWSGLKNVSVYGKLDFDAIYGKDSFNPWFPTRVLAQQETAAGDSTSTDEHSSVLKLRMNTLNLAGDVKVNASFDAHAGVLAQFDLAGDDSSSRVSLDEAYVTLHDMAGVPFYVRAGQMYLPFGQNKDRHPLRYGLTQMFTQINDLAVQLGYRAQGMDVSVYGMRGNAYKAFSDIKHPGYDTWKSNGKFNNYGVNLGYAAKVEGIQMNANLGWMRDVRRSMFLSLVGAGISGVSEVIDIHGMTDNQLDKPMSGMSAHLGMNQGDFDAAFDYVSVKLPEAADTYSNCVLYGVDGGVHCDIMGAHTRFGLGYQKTDKKFEGLGLFPKSRMIASWKVPVARFLDVTVQYIHDTPFDNEALKAANEVGVRLALHF